MILDKFAHVSLEYSTNLSCPLCKYGDMSASKNEQTGGLTQNMAAHSERIAATVLTRW